MNEPSEIASDVVPADPSSSLELLAASVRDYGSRSKADGTKREYRRIWTAFVTWCSAHQLASLPAGPDTVALYLAHRADLGRAVATLQLELAAIAAAHTAAGLASPRADARLRAVLEGIRRTKGIAQRRVAPLLPEDLRRISLSLPGNLLGARDRALLLLGFAGAFRRSELVSLNIEDLAFNAEGVQVLLRRSKTDQVGEGHLLGIAFGGNRETCPVRNLRDWLERSGLTAGPIFTPVDRHGRLGASRLSARAVADVVQRRLLPLASVPVVGVVYSGHSLRAGHVTAAVRAGKSVHAIQRQTGHASLATLARYVREGTLFSDNSSSGIGL